MSIHPIRTSRAIEEAYCGYLETTFELADSNLRSQLGARLREKGRLVRGPMVQATMPFRKAASLSDLVGERVLSPLFLRYPFETLERPLYRHQENAIRKMVSGQRNIVVATGTGSGKTECFMIPIANHLMLEHEAGTLGPGVRALLLYPMNALANDQVKRLRDLFGPFPFMTFGRYTGETPNKKQEALDAYRNTFKRDPLPNEMISREEMKVNPPNVLITNYAMLEYLLLRPADNVFFDGASANHWRFVVLDEAHTYSGVKGMETAMLLRRVRDRVVDGVVGRLQCAATSATLGRGLDDAPEIMQFASQLFSEPFEYYPNDVDRQDLIVAEREPVDRANVWGSPDRALYGAWHDILLRQRDETRTVSELAEIGTMHGVGAGIITQALAESASCVDSFLFKVLSGDERIICAQELLSDDPLSIRELAIAMFGEDVDIDEAEQCTVAMVSLAVRARSSSDDRPLLPARYHLMLRALSGAWVSFAPTPRVHLDRVSQVAIGTGTAMSYELGVCYRCGAAYILGIREEQESRPGWRLVPASSEDMSAAYYAVMGSEDVSAATVDEDEDPLQPGTAGAIHELCPLCGDMRRVDSLGLGCSCGADRIRLLETKRAGRVVSTCVVCGARNTRHGIVRDISATPEAAASVITTALYQELHQDEHTSISISQEPSPEPEHDDEGWEVATRPEAPSPVDAKKILVFSDSRQDAAYFAPYIQDTYNQMLRRNIVLCAAREAIAASPDLPLMVSDLWDEVERVWSPLTQQGQDTRRQARIDAQTWVLHEFAGRDRHCLESLGLIGFDLQRPAGWQPPPYYTVKWGLTDAEIWDLYHVMLDSVRAVGAISTPKGVNERDEIFEPGNLAQAMRLSGRSRDIKAWRPSARSLANKRSDYLVRLARRIGLPGAAEDWAEALLDGMWNRDLRPGSTGGMWSGYFQTVGDARNSTIAFRLEPSKWIVMAYGTPRSPQWYACNQCGKLTLRNVRGVCPQYRCTGTLAPSDVARRLESNHYVRLYESKDLPRRMRAEEHTAQLTPGRAAQSQIDFQEGRINVLSCSTTFELGVDLGDLEVVLMKNMPPSPANYVQRAGRAGRRTKTAAMVVTYAQNRPHDAFHFRNPARMINGHIAPPHFGLDNEKILLRHVYAVALAEFWRSHQDYVDKVEHFFFRDTDAAGVDALGAFLAERPERVKTRLRRVIPDGMKEAVGVDSWGWVDRLFAPVESHEPGPLALARAEVESDMRALKERRRELFDRDKPTDNVTRLMNTIMKRNLINFLASRNVLPRYGFPVDVVELNLKLNHYYKDDDVEPQRDLRLAVSEYAPEGQVVAAGNVWTSRYLQKMPQRLWLRYYYGMCSQCQNHVAKLDVGDSNQMATCAVCGARVKCTDTFVVPEFGFLVDTSEPQKAGSQRPERTFSSRVFFSGLGTESEEQTLEMPGGTVMVSTSREGKLAVVNEARGAQFRICQSCGYGVIGTDKIARTAHINAYGRECRGKFIRAALGHEFRSDIARIRFGPHAPVSEGFWYSMLYALIEGACLALDIERLEVDGCIQRGDAAGHDTNLILFDSVPGGAGHVQRLRSLEALYSALEAALEKMASCECGDESASGSCYSCLRNYSNQFCHDKLDRGLVIRFLTELGFGK